MNYLTDPVIPRLTENELRKFVLGVADRQVFTSAHMTFKEFESFGVVVFIPLIGGVGPEVGVHVPPEPKLPPGPKPPEEKPNPDKPQQLKNEVKRAADVEVDPKHVTELEFRIRWGRAPESAVEDYYAEIVAKNEAIEAEYQAAIAAWEKENTKLVEAWEAECLAVWEANEAEKARFKEAQDTYNLEHDVFIKAHKEWEELCDRWRRDYCRQIGVIYEWMDKALPRSVNGCPTFGSCHILHREDWERAKEAIRREQERRESIAV